MESCRTSPASMNPRNASPASMYPRNFLTNENKKSKNILGITVKTSPAGQRTGSAGFAWRTFSPG